MRRYFIIAYLIVIAAILTWSADFALDNILMFISSLCVVSFIYLLFYWLFTSPNKWLSIGISFLGLVAAFFTGLFLYTETSAGMLSEITTKKFFFWSIYELILVGFVYLMMRGIIQLISKK